MEMRRFQIALFAGSIVAAVLLAPPASGGQEGLPDKSELDKARDELGWEAFKDWQKIGEYLIVLLGAAVLGAALAYHPFASRRASVEELEQPKIIITYTVVGALIAVVVAPIPQMAFAIFGIGGLMRFRTILGAAKETGRVILATVIGLLCGLQFWMAAIVGAAFAWILIYLLESRESRRLVVRGVPSETLAQTVEAYANVLRELKCSFGTPRKNPRKGQVSFILRMHRTITPELIEEACTEKVPKEFRGTPDWPED